MPHSINEWQRQTRLSQERSQARRNEPPPNWVPAFLTALMVLAVVVAFVLR